MFDSTEIIDTLMIKAMEYVEDDTYMSGQKPPRLICDFVVEKYIDHRNFPKHFSDDKIRHDLESHMATLSMCVTDLWQKYGAEGETSHSEKNINRVYENSYVSKSLLEDIHPYVGCF